MPLYYVDFTPQLLQAELPFSTLSLTGSCGGPKYESFSILLSRANEWLRRRCGIRLVHAEVVEVGGVYSSGAQLSKSKDAQIPGIPAFLKIIRLWYLHEASSGESTCCQLGYMHVIPSRLESNPRAFNPKFQTLETMLDNLNQQLVTGEKVIDGKLLSIQTCLFRFSSRNCSLDPERSFWMINDTSEVHVCFYFTVFYIRSTAVRSKTRPPPLVVHELHFRDFASKFVTSEEEKKSSRKSETISSLMDRLRQSLDETPLNVICIQTVDHHAYYRCAMDTPGFEEKTLSNPHYRSSLSGLLQCAKVLRVYYCVCSQCARVPPDDSSAHYSLAHKTFHVTRSPFPCSQLDFSQSDLDLQARLEANVMSQINDWIDSSGVTVMSVETVKLGVTDGQYRRISADDTHFRSMLSPTAGTLYAVRLYVLVPSESVLQVDLKPVPPYLRARYFNCAIL